MNQKDLIDAINQEGPSHYSAGLSKVVIDAVLCSLAAVATRELKRGGEVTLPGLGKLSVKTRAARKGRNPATREEMDIPAKTVPHFSAAKALKDAVA